LIHFKTIVDKLENYLELKFQKLSWWLGTSDLVQALKLKAVLFAKLMYNEIKAYKWVVSI
jgi:hypothetical protein